MFSSIEIASNERDAKRVMLQIQQAGVRIAGSTILDVGFGFGFNAEAMSAMGAKVFGVEPDTVAYDWAIQAQKNPGGLWILWKIAEYAERLRRSS